MGLFLRQTDDRSKLQSRLAAELQEKVRAAQAMPGDQPEVESSDLLAEGQQTRPAGMVLLVLSVIILLVAFIWVAAGL